MTAALAKLRDRVDALTLRERVLVLGAAIVVLVGLWEAVLAAPLDAREARVSQRIEQSRERIAELNRAIETAAQGISEGMPAQTNRLEALRERVAANDESLRVLASDLVDPAQMRDVLEDLILERPGLELVQIRNVPAEPMFDAADDEGREDDTAAGVRHDDAAPELYRHAVVIELEATYLDALEYLREVENLPWQLYWPRFELETEQYPRTRIVLELHTLSLDEEWIGV